MREDSEDSSMAMLFCKITTNTGINEGEAKKVNYRE